MKLQYKQVSAITKDDFFNLVCLTMPNWSKYQKEFLNTDIDENNMTLEWAKIAIKAELSITEQNQLNKNLTEGYHNGLFSKVEALTISEEDLAQFLNIPVDKLSELPNAPSSSYTIGWARWAIINTVEGTSVKEVKEFNQAVSEWKRENCEEEELSPKAKMTKLKYRTLQKVIQRKTSKYVVDANTLEDIVKCFLGWENAEVEIKFNKEKEEVEAIVYN